jgi:hypothetical protein
MKGACYMLSTTSCVLLLDMGGCAVPPITQETGNRKLSCKQASFLPEENSAVQQITN